MRRRRTAFSAKQSRKSGCLPEECLSLAEFILTDCPKLKLMGLMTIGKVDAPPEPYFTVSHQSRRND